MSDLASLPTPALILDEAIMARNVARMAGRLAALGVAIRPHVKTHKSIHVGNRVRAAGNTCGITVSTLGEAEYFYDAGFDDILYAVGTSAEKIERVASLIERGCTLTVVTDNLAMARLVADAAARADIVLPVLVELDVDGHRSGVDPDGAGLLDLAAFLSAAPSLSLAGVMTHAGGSYAATTPDELARHAEREVTRTRHAAERLRATGLACPTVSIGSTPTASSYVELDGITEVRAGVYVFYDLYQAGIGIVGREDIALSVLTTVIGHQPERGWVITDAGWMAMSRDLGTARQAVDFGYGQVCDREGDEIDDVIMGSANQEHGIITARPGRARLSPDDFPVGTRLRIKPNHACATAAQFDHFDVLTTDDDLAQWERLRGR